MCTFISVHRVHSPFWVNPAYEIKILYDDLHIQFYGLSILQGQATTLKITAIFVSHIFIHCVTINIQKILGAKIYIYIYIAVNFLSVKF